MSDNTKLQAKEFVPTEPGVYYGPTHVEEEVYHNKIQAGSSTMFKIADESTWAHVWAKYFDPDREELQNQDDGKADKADAVFGFGKAYHCLLLEPYDFHNRFAISPDHTRPEFKGYLAGGRQLDAALAERGLKKNGTVLEKAVRLLEDGETRPLWPIIMEDFYGQVEGRTVLTAKQYDALMKMRARVVQSNTIMTGLIEGHAEATFIWEDPETGLLLKARTDYWRPGVAISDLKSALSAAPWEFPHKAEKLGYHIQHAMYLDGVKYAAGDDLGDKFMFIAQEKTSPYLCAPFQCTHELIKEGYKAYRRGVHQLANILGSDKEMRLAASNWPGYDTETIWPIGNPTFSIRRKRREYK